MVTLVQEGSSSGPHTGPELQCPGLPLPRGDVVVQATFIWAELEAACGSFKQRGHLYRERLLLPAAPRGLSLLSCPGDMWGLGAVLLLSPGAGRVPARLGWGCTGCWFAGGLAVLHQGSAARAQPGCPGAGQHVGMGTAGPFGGMAGQRCPGCSNSPSKPSQVLLLPAAQVLSPRHCCRHRASQPQLTGIHTALSSVGPSVSFQQGGDCWLRSTSDLSTWVRAATGTWGMPALAPQRQQGCRMLSAQPQLLPRTPSCTVLIL